MNETRWMLNPVLGVTAQPHLRDGWCRDHGCQYLVILEAPFMCDTHKCGHCGGCKAAHVDGLLSDAQDRLAAAIRVIESTEWACGDGHEHDWHGRRRLEQRLKQAVRHA